MLVVGRLEFLRYHMDRHVYLLVCKLAWKRETLLCGTRNMSSRRPSAVEELRPAQQRWISLTVLACLLLLAWLLARQHIYESSIATDEGVLAHSAERVMNGEIPHRDFTAPWSGGLDWFHAEVFRVFGPSYRILHATLLVAWLFGIAATFNVARSIVKLWPAALLVLVAAEWTIPMLPHPLPSWHWSFLGLLSLATFFRYLQTRHARWLVIAGAATAAACAVKITGVYFAAAFALSFVWIVQEETPVAGAVPPRRGVYRWVVTLGLVTYLGLVLMVFRGVASVNAAYHYLLPSLVLVGLLLYREWRQPSDADSERGRRLAALVAPFIGGALVVLVPWLGFYAAHDALGALFTGLFVTPQARFAVASYELPGLRSAVLSMAPFALLLGAAPFIRHPLRRVDRAAFWLLIAAMCAMSYEGSPIVLVVWYGFRLMTPVTTLLGVWWLATSDERVAVPAQRRVTVFVVVATAATASLIQIPFALYTYLLYFVSFLLLAMAAVFTSPRSMPRDVPAGLLLFLLWFGYRNPDSIARPANPERDRLATLAMPRGGLLVSQEDSAQYATLMQAIARHDTGEFIYVWHDSPQIYFLAGKRNPTRTMFEVFDDSLARSTPYLVDRLKRTGVRLVVLTDPDGAVRPLASDFRAWIDSTYPLVEQVGGMQVRWRTAVQR